MEKEFEGKRLKGEKVARLILALVFH
jgi:hypothetical protein